MPRFEPVEEFHCSCDNIIGNHFVVKSGVVVPWEVLKILNSVTNALLLTLLMPTSIQFIKRKLVTGGVLDRTR